MASNFSNVSKFRQTVDKVVGLLTNKGLVVTQEGDKAEVIYHPTTGAAVRVNIPTIPDNATDEFLSVVRGFIDHQCGHALETDSRVLKNLNASDKKTSGVAEVMEDVRIERRMRDLFPGTANNINSTWEFVLEKDIKKRLAAERSSGKRNAILFPVLMQALAGNHAANDFLTKNNLWGELEDIKNKIAPLLPEINGELPDTQSAVDLSRKIVQYIEDVEQSPSDGDGEEGDDEQDGKPDDKKQDNKDKKKKDNKDKKDKSDDKKKDDKSKDDKEKSKDKDKNSDDEDSDSDEDGEEEDSDKGDKSGDDADDEGEEQEGDGDESDDEGEPSDEEGEDGEGDGDGEDSEDDDGDADSDSDQDGKSAEPKPVEKETLVKQPVELNFEEVQSVDKSMQNLIKIAFDKDSRGSYTPFSRDYDQWIVADPETPHAKEVALREVKKSEDSLSRSVGQMTSHIRRMFAQTDFSVNVGGHRSGKLQSSALHRVTQNDSRVFYRREQHSATDTAISLVIDCSGSMSGDKIMLAKNSALAFSNVLEKCGIKHEILGFTTGDMPPSAYQYRREARNFSRFRQIIMYVFKTFEENYRDGRVRLQTAVMNNGSKVNLCTNIDGESILYAGERLLKQHEQRKIMIVFSDGMPAGDGGSGGDLVQHLKDAVKYLESKKVETIGIGIQSSEVHHFYPKHVIVNKVEELPAVVVGQLSKILIKSAK